MTTEEFLNELHGLKSYLQSSQLQHPMLKKKHAIALGHSTSGNSLGGPLFFPSLRKFRHRKIGKQ